MLDNAYLMRMSLETVSNPLSAMSDVKISVTMPCYNCEATVGRALDTLLAQTADDFEIVAVDDGSADGTYNVLREYARKHDEVRAFSIPHGGVIAAANAALEAAQGEYIARMDADDEVLPERLAAQAALLDSDERLGLVGCRIRFGGDREECAGYAHYVDWTNTLLSHEEISAQRFVEFPVPNPSIMFRRRCMENFGMYRDGDFPEDYELFLRWLDQGVRMAKVDTELLVWNDPPDRLSRTHPRYDMQAFYRTKAEYLSRWLAQRNPHHPAVHVLGSGRVTRKRASMLKKYGVRFDAYYDVDPRKVGNTIRGVPVLPRDEVPEPGVAFLLSYVASRGAREEIDEFLSSRGYELGRHWLPVA